MLVAEATSLLVYSRSSPGGRTVANKKLILSANVPVLRRWATSPDPLTSGFRASMAKLLCTTGSLRQLERGRGLHGTETTQRQGAPDQPGDRRGGPGLGVPP